VRVVSELYRRDSACVRLLGEAPMPVTLRDFDGRFRHGNVHAEALFGGRPVGGRLACELLDERASAVLAEQAARVHAGEKSMTCELETTLHDGRSRSFLVTDYPAHADDGRPLGVGSVWLDVTERARADHRFRDLLEAQADAIVIVNASGQIVIVNEQTVKMFGYEREELLSQPVEILLPQDLRERHTGYRDRYSANPHLRPMGTGYDLCARRKDGTGFPVEVSLSTLTTEDGQLITSRIADISARKQAESDLQAAEEHFRLAFAHTPIGMALVALDGRFMRVNRALCEITGYQEQTLLRCTLQDITHPDDVETDADKLQELIAGRIRAYQTERRHLNAFGHAVWSTLSVSLVRDGHGDPIHFVAQIEDISERKQHGRTAGRRRVCGAAPAHQRGQGDRSGRRAEAVHRGRADQRGRPHLQPAREHRRRRHRRILARQGLDPGRGRRGDVHPEARPAEPPRGKRSRVQGRGLARRPVGSDNETEDLTGELADEQVMAVYPERDDRLRKSG
jgi:PAS domain S-box-containing protein